MAGTTRTNIKVCDSVGSTGPQPAINLFGYEIDEMTLQTTVTGVGAVTAVVQVEVSNDGIGWLFDSVSTLSLSGNGIASMGFTSIYQWQMVRANIISISSGAKVTVTLAG